MNGFDYAGFGIASSTKEAEANAAIDFIGFLIGAGIISADAVPDEILVRKLIAEHKIDATGATAVNFVSMFKAT